MLSPSGLPLRYKLLGVYLFIAARLKSKRISYDPLNDQSDKRTLDGTER